MISEEFSGKKVQNAIDEGLKKLGKTIDEVDIKIISQGGFLKKAKVLITVEGEEPQKSFSDKFESKIANAKIIEQKAKTDFKKPEVKQDVKPQVKAEVRQDVKPQVKAEVRQEVKPQAKPEVRQEVKPQAKPEIKPEVKPAVQKNFEQKGDFRQNNNFKKRDDRPRDDRPRDDRPRDKFNKKPNGEKREDRVPPTQVEADKAVVYLEKLLANMGIEATIKTELSDELKIEIITIDSVIIGHRGETLDAVQYLVSLAVNTEKAKYVHVCLDALGYRQKRHDSLVALAGRMADKADKTGRRISLEPMTSGDRRVIHAALSNDDRVSTRSDGFEPNRKIVIFPKRRQQDVAKTTDVAPVEKEVAPIVAPVENVVAPVVAPVENVVAPVVAPVENVAIKEEIATSVAVEEPTAKDETISDKE